MALRAWDAAGTRDDHRHPPSRRWRLALVTLAIAGLATGCNLLPPYPGAATAPPSTNTSAGTTPASQWPTSMFSAPLAAGAKADTANSPNSAAYTNDVVQDYHNNYGAVGVNGMPVWTVDANQPAVRVAAAANCNDFTPSTGTSIPIPANAATSSGDSPLVIFQPSSHKAWELWQAHQASSGSWTACWGGELSTATSDGVFPAPYGLSASGISYLATTITETDVASGSINHALSIAIPRCNAPEVAPADRTDCGSDPGQPPEGTRFRLPPNLAMPAGLTPFAQMVFRALQTYGTVVTDQAGAVMISAESPSDWTAQGHQGTDPITASWQGQPEYATLNGIPWSSLQVIN